MSKIKRALPEDFDVTEVYPDDPEALAGDLYDER